MRRSFFVFGVIIILIVMISPVEFCLALDFDITDVVEVGNIYSGGMYRPAQWSPDGTMLVYFNDGQLLVSDTLGNSWPVTKIELYPHRYVWISNDEILLYHKTLDENLNKHKRLSRINVVNGQIDIIMDYAYRMGLEESPTEASFNGPFKTVEGSAYYILNQGKSEQIKIVRSLSDQSTPKNRPEHILRTGVDALYLVQTDFMDSIKISNKPYRTHMGIMPISLNLGHSHIMFGGNIIRLADDLAIVLDTLPTILNRPEGTDCCGVGAESFSPVRPEVAFRLSCDDGHSYSVNRTCIYNYVALELTILDSLMDLSNCTRPEFSPDGKRISFISDGFLYFLVREVKP